MSDDLYSFTENRRLKSSRDLSKFRRIFSRRYRNYKVGTYYFQSLRPLVVFMLPHSAGSRSLFHTYCQKTHWKLKLFVFIVGSFSIGQYFWYMTSANDDNEKSAQSIVWAPIYYFWTLFNVHSGSVKLLYTNQTTTTSTLSIKRPNASIQAASVFGFSFNNVTLYSSSLKLLDNENERLQPKLLDYSNVTATSISKTGSFVASSIPDGKHLSATNDSLNGQPSQVSIMQKLQPQNSSLHQCPVLPPLLVGPIKVRFDFPSWSYLHTLYSNLEPGGHGKPASCLSRNRVAIILPYRDREEHLRGFLHNMHSFLTKQQLDYAIFVVEQIPGQTFNRAKLFNVGYVEAMKLYPWQCAIFHDVDLYPEDDRNIYSCPDQPRHMSVAVDKFAYKLPYNEIFGGITALTSEQFEKLNGFSNDYWGWGGEDDDMALRVRFNKYTISRYRSEIARYKMVKHAQDKENPINPCRYNLMYKAARRWRKDGLSSLNYTVYDFKVDPLFVYFKVDLLEKASKDRLAMEYKCR